MRPPRSSASALAMLMAPARCPRPRAASWIVTSTPASKHIIGIGREVTARRRDGSVLSGVVVRRRGALPRRAGASSASCATSPARNTPRKRRLRHREQMMHASRLTTMGEMAAAMAHELNQPLSAIATYTAACQRFLGQGDEARADVAGGAEGDRRPGPPRRPDHPAHAQFHAQPRVAAQDRRHRRADRRNPPAGRARCEGQPGSPDHPDRPGPAPGECRWRADPAGRAQPACATGWTPWRKPRPRSGC